ncbi:unnamed protein product [Orchesella dallaii]|uniref:Tumour suppressor p53-binding protein-1 Tudor domain-containing protein n=1 Tax=Orchesella dallaii TaxID=48710 RepID=A0ABP1QJK1_9HEXA
MGRKRVIKRKSVDNDTEKLSLAQSGTAKRSRVGKTPKPICSSATVAPTPSSSSNPISASSATIVSVPQADKIPPAEQTAADDDSIIEEELEKGTTTWTNISPNALVFARWIDNKFYSGQITGQIVDEESKWMVDYDDEDPREVMEADILPIDIIGAGTDVLITKKRLSHLAQVIGHKVFVDPANGEETVKYAIKLKMAETPIWAMRSDLYIKSTLGERLREEYELSVKKKGENADAMKECTSP